MPIRDVQLVARTRDLALSKRLADTWEHIENILRAFLPTTLTLDDCVKLVVSLPVDVEEEREYAIKLRVAVLRLHDFDPHSYLALPPEQQLTTVLAIFRTAFARLARLRGFDAASAEDALHKTGVSGGVYSFSPRKLMRSHSTRRAKGEVCITFRRGGTDVHTVLRGATGREVARAPVVIGEYWPTAWFDYFAASWEGDSFVLKNRTSKETHRTDWAVEISRLIQQDAIRQMS